MRVVPLLTLESQIKRALRRHLHSLGLGRDDRGRLTPPSGNKDTAGAIDRLTMDLISKLSDFKTKFIRMDTLATGGQDLIGIKSAQLFYLIKEIKTPADTTPEDNLKMPLLTHLLGQGVVQALKDQQGNEYFCATEAAWQKVGVKPNIRAS